MAYSLTDRFSANGNGTVLARTLWHPGIAHEFPMLTFWSQFMSDTFGGERIAGDGLLFRVSYLNELAVASTPLTQGTPVPIGVGTGIQQVIGTLKEYGEHQMITRFAEWVSGDLDLQTKAAQVAARQALKTRDYLIGATAHAVTASTFTITGTAAVKTNYGTTAEGTQSWNMDNAEIMRAALQTMGVPPFADGLYRVVGRPGMFSNIKSEIMSDAARLALQDVYTHGQVKMYGGFLFIEEAGINNVCTGSTSLIFGADPIVGWDDFDREDLVVAYPDSGEDGGRAVKVLWRATAGYVVPIAGAANSRVWKVYSNQ